MEGKLPFKMLEPILKTIPRGDLLAPKSRIAMDAAIIRCSGRYVITASGSIRDYRKNHALELVTRLSEKVRSVGAKPRLLAPVVLAPKATSVRKIRQILREMTKAASLLGVTVGKGHTEITPWLDRVTIVATMIGTNCDLRALQGRKKLLRK